MMGQTTGKTPMDKRFLSSRPRLRQDHRHLVVVTALAAACSQDDGAVSAERDASPPTPVVDAACPTDKPDTVGNPDAAAAPDATVNHDSGHDPHDAAPDVSVIADGSDTPDVSPLTDASADAPDTSVSAPVGSKLLLAGGALEDTSLIYKRMFDEVGGPQNARVLIDPSASDNPASSFAYHKDIFSRIFGVPEGNIRLLFLAEVNDDSTPSVDESTWKDNGDAQAEADKITGWGNVVWFSAGDQSRTARTHVHKTDKTDTKVLAAMRAKLAAGNLLIGGSSAGAALMSDPMLTGGGKTDALDSPPVQRDFWPTAAERDASAAIVGDPVVTSVGLGFLPPSMNVLVDSHFFAQGRAGRLVRALDARGKRVGIGINETTGFLVDLAQGTGEVVGSVTNGNGFVGIVSIGDPGCPASGMLPDGGACDGIQSTGFVSPYTFSNVRFSYLGVGDKYLLPSPTKPDGAFLPLPSKASYAVCAGFYGTPKLTSDGFGARGLLEMMEWVADGTEWSPGDCRAEGVSLLWTGSRASPPPATTDIGLRGYFLRVEGDAKSQAYWSNAAGYAVTNAKVSLGPVTGTVRGL